MDAVPYVCGLIVAAVFLSAGTLKLIQPKQFVRELGDYRLVPRRLLWPVALLLPALELGGATLMVIPATHTVGAILLASLLAVFSGAVARNLRSGKTAISCACFGRVSTKLGAQVLVRNGLLGAAALLSLASTTESITVDAAMVVAMSTVLGWLAVETVRMFETLAETPV